MTLTTLRAVLAPPVRAEDVVEAAVISLARVPARLRVHRVVPRPAPVASLLVPVLAASKPLPPHVREAGLEARQGNACARAGLSVAAAYVVDGASRLALGAALEQTDARLGVVLAP